MDWVYRKLKRVWRMVLLEWNTQRQKAGWSVLRAVRYDAALISAKAFRRHRKQAGLKPVKNVVPIRARFGQPARRLVH